MKACVDFSVVVPVYNQWELIPALLHCLRAQSLPSGTYEVLLVDNGSKVFIPPDTQGLDVSFLDCQSPGSYAARNQGVKAARGKWVVFTDADCLPRPNWLSSMYQAVRARQGQKNVFAGCVKIVHNSAQPSPFEVYDLVKGIRQDLYVRQGYAATANLCASRTLIESLGLFNHELYSGGDIDFCERAVRAGAELHYIEEAVVHHPARTSWDELSLKARRVKGGHFMRATGYRKLVIAVKTLIPPVRAVKSFLRNPDFGIKFRLIACAIQFRLWLVDIFEVFKLALNAEAERR